MTASYRALAAVAFSSMFVHPLDGVRADPMSLPSGSYEIITRLELPHLERWAIDQTTRICLSNPKRSNEIPVPVLSANNPFEKCAAANFTADEVTLQYDIVCPGRGAAKAHAIYTLMPGKFAGRVMMVMGAKNMTMTEVQHARRIGDCEPAVLESAARF
jgi:hypothetical protein